MVKMVFKSFLAGVVGAGLFFSFFMSISIAVMAIKTRLASPSVYTRSVEVTPGAFFQQVGLPLSGVAFTVFFAMGMRRFRRLGADSTRSR